MALCDGCGEKQMPVSQEYQQQFTANPETGKTTKQNIFGIVGGVVLLFHFILNIRKFISLMFLVFMGFEVILLQMFLFGVLVTAVLLITRRGNKWLGIALSISSVIFLLEKFLYIFTWAPFLFQRGSPNRYLLVIIFFEMLLFLFLILGAFINTKFSLKKLMPIYLLLPVLIFVFMMISNRHQAHVDVINFLSSLSFCIGFMLVGLYIIANQRYIDKKTQQNIYSCGYIDMSKHILLCLFTLGIWQYIWIYRTTAYLNKTPDAEQYDPTAKLLLCMFVPFYAIYWIYNHAQRIDTLSKTKNSAHSYVSNICLITGIFVPLISFIIMQDKINVIAKTATQVSQARYTKEKPDTNFEEIKKLKEFFDAGIITQEEFDAKKKQLLGL